MTTVLIDADHFQFVVVDPVDGLEAHTFGSDIQDLALLWEDDTLGITTGAQYGPVEVTAQHLSVAPGNDETWEDVVEISLKTGGRLVVAELMGDPGLTWSTDSGWVRLRVSAAGRDVGRSRDYEDLDDPVPVERYLLQTWSAAPDVPVALRLGSAAARPDDQ